MLLHCSGLSKSFGGVAVLEDVGYRLERGMTLGLVGENGAGKSTLMNILGGVVAADSGRMLLDGAPYAPKSPRQAIEAGIAFIHQELNLFPNLTVAENLLVGAPARFGLLDRAAARRRVAELLGRLDAPLAPDTPVERLSQGERQLVEIAKALEGSARVVIFDEPTTSLSVRESERLFEIIGRLKVRGIGTIYISHTLEEVLRVADSILVLRGGRAVAAGPRGEFTLEGLIPLMVGRALGELYPVRPARKEPRQPALEARGVDEPGVVRVAHLEVREGEVVGIAGLMGSGRTELARILFGLDRAAQGEILLDGKRIDHLSPARRIARGLAFLTESRREDGLLMGASAGANIGLAGLRAFARFGFLDGGRLAARVGEAARDVRFGAATLESPASTLSGGNQQKVALAKWLVQPPRALVLDEPTRGVDVGARQEIYQTIARLAEAGVAVLMISSELEELTGMCDRILVMCRGELGASFDGPRYGRQQILAAAFGQPAGAA